MNKELLNKALESLIEFASDVALWAKGEIPIVIQELLKYRTIMAISYSIACFVVMVIAGYTVCKAIIKMQDEDFDDRWIAVTVFGGIAFCICLAGFVTHTKEAIMIYVAPRIYILEYLKDFIR